MTQAESIPIVILSEDDDDDDDDDIVVLKEEKVPIKVDDDDEVIFIAQSKPAKNLVAGGAQTSGHGQVKSEGNSGKDLNRTLSISTALGMSLSLTNSDQCPLDLSRRNDQSEINCSMPSGTSPVSPPDQLSTKQTAAADKENSAIDMEEAGGAQSDLLDSVASSSLDSSLFNAGSPLSSAVDTDSSDSIPVSSTSDRKWVTSPVSSTDISRSWGLEVADQSGLTVPVCSSSDLTNNSTQVSTSNTQPVGTGNAMKADTSNTLDDIFDLMFDTNDQSFDSSTPNFNSKVMCMNSAQAVDNKSTFSSGNAISHPSVPCSSHQSSTDGSSHLACDMQTSSLPPSLSPNDQVTSSSNKKLIHANNNCFKSLTTVKSQSSNNANCTSSGINTSMWTFGASASKIAQSSLPPRKRVRLDVKTDDNFAKPPLTFKKSPEACVHCQNYLYDLKVSRCTQGHPACSGCLEEQVKLILTDKQGSLKCVNSTCGSYYPMSELKHSLPMMVVDVLEDKLHKDYINFVTDMMLNNAGSGSSDSSAGTSGMSLDKNNRMNQKRSTEMDVEGTSQKEDQCISDLLTAAKDLPFETQGQEKKSSKPTECDDHPQKWTPMDKKTNLLIMTLEPECDEYVDIAVKFHNTMNFPSADIVKISRVQNPILWRYYQLKKTEMIHENDGHEVDERQLFHGTNSSVVEAICRKGFDWRVCGKHGSVYGQGSYFAKAASYSHQYTDKLSSSLRSSRLMTIRTISALTSSRCSSTVHQSRCSNSSSNTSSLRPQSAVFIGPFTQSQLGQYNLIPIPPPAHTSLPSHSGPQVIYRGGQPPQNLAQGNTMLPSSNQSAQSGNMSSNQVITNRQSFAGLQNTPVNGGLFNPGTPQSTPTNSAVQNSLFNPGNSNSNNLGFSNSSLQLLNQLGVRSNCNSGFTSPLQPSLSRLHPHGIGKETAESQMSRAVSMSDLAASPTRKMFLAKVLVGKYTGGNSGLRRPPPFYPCSEPYGKCYDSCVDNIWDPKIYVIFDSNQAYPEYIIEYNFVND